MNANDKAPPALDDPRLVAALDEYVATLEAGGRPNRQAFLARHPDIADALNACLEGMEALHASDSVARPGPAADWQPGAALGDFRIVREIGRGGMGVVYEAEQLSLGRRIALKVLPFALTLDQRQLQRFKNEARAAAQLHHQHIVPIYSVGSDRSVHFYAMQYVEGQSLAGVIQQLRRLSRKESAALPTAGDQQTGPYDPQATPSADTISEPLSALATAYSTSAPRFFETVAQLGVQAAEALAHAHEYGVVHRDIKPANLLVDDHGHLWITDFGLAQFQSDIGLTLTGDLLGTLGYMSPEQALAKRGLVDHRTDLYSLGATLYELLTLEPAYDGRDREELLRQITFEEPRPPRRRNPAMPVDLETIVLKAMAKAVEDRYTSAGDLAADLRRFLENRPIKARRPTLLERGRKWVRRHQALVGTGLLIAVVALAASTVFVAREQEKTKAALDRERDSFRQARDAVDFFTQLVESELAEAPPPFQDLRKKALEASLAYYQGFIDQRHDDPSLQAELTASQERVAKFLKELTDLQGFGHVLRLGDPGVQDDLRLTPDVRDSLRQLADRFQEQHRSLYRDGGTAGREDRRRQFVDLAVGYQQEVKTLLTEDQAKRLKQIDIQLRGPGAFSDPDVIEALGLTAEQRNRIRDIQASSFFGHCDPIPSKGHQSDGRMMRGPGPREVEKQILAELTKDQQARWEKLIGARYSGPFHFGRRGGPPRPYLQPLPDRPPMKGDQ